MKCYSAGLFVKCNLEVFEMFEKTVEVLKEYVDPDTEITMDSALIDDLGLTSIDVISVVAAFEDEYGFEIPDREINAFRTVKDVVDYLEKTVSE